MYPNVDDHGAMRLFVMCHSINYYSLLLIWANCLADDAMVALNSRHQQHDGAQADQPEDSCGDNIHNEDDDNVQDCKVEPDIMSHIMHGTSTTINSLSSKFLISSMALLEHITYAFL